MLALLIQTASAAAPPAGAWFTYTFRQDVRGTEGEYVGYSDRTRSTGRYEVTAASDATLAVRARYDWTYASNDGESESGTEDRDVTVALPERRYSSRIDLDDEALATMPPASLAPWFWIDPATPDGAAVRILDMDCERSAGLRPVPGRADVEGMLVACAGEAGRDDDYGVFRFTYEDQYWYDPATGFVLAARYSERDVGMFEGGSAAFALEEAFDLTAASYAPARSTPTPTPEREERASSASGDAPPADVVSWLFRLGSGLCGVVGLVLAVGFLGRAIQQSRRPPARVRGTFGETSLALLTDPLELLALDPQCTRHFAPFLEDFARKALAAGDPVAIATADGKLAGFAWNDREASIGTIFTPDTATANGLARWIGAQDFFSEHRHQRSDGQPWFNVHETYVVLTLEPVAELAYDKILVTRMTDADRPAVEALCAAVFEVKAERWLGAQLAQGDLGFVAKVDGNLAGFGLATVCGERGRLHTLAVDPAHRDKGIGGELVRARLTALARLGVRQAMVEIASWNVASLHLARQAGFADAGELFVETTGTSRAKRTIVRR